MALSVFGSDRSSVNNASRFGDEGEGIENNLEIGNAGTPEEAPRLRRLERRYAPDHRPDGVARARSQQPRFSLSL